MSLNLALFTKLVEFCRTKLTTIVSSQKLNLSTNLIFNQVFKFIKLTKEFNFTFEKLNKCPSL